MIKEMDVMTSDNAKFGFDCDKNNYKSPTHVKCLRQLMITRGMDPKYVDLSIKVKSNEEDYSSDSTSSSSGSSSSSSSSSSSATGSDGSNPMLECAAGTMCRAPTDAILPNSTHTCRGCSKKIHSALLCGSSLSEMIITNPSVVGSKLKNGHIIEEDNDNKTRSICFTCMGPLSIFMSYKN
jgi:hypothetical protein